MRNLKYVILGLLTQKPMTGYEIKQKFEGALSEFWYANHSQIYPELKRLTEEDMIQYKIQIVGNSLEKKVYTITEAGKKEFNIWLKKREGLEATPKDIFRLRLFFSNELPEEMQMELIQDQLELHRERLQHLEKNKTYFGGLCKEEMSAELCDYMVLEGAIMREEAYCNWLKKCLQMCMGTGGKWKGESRWMEASEGEYL